MGNGGKDMSDTITAWADEQKAKEREAREEQEKRDEHARMVVALPDWENRIPTPKGELHRRICQELNDTYKAKNADYGDSFAMVRDLYPESAIMVRILDKVNRLRTLLNGKQAEVDESIEDSLKDLANYCIMELIERKVDKAVVR